jgi:hypothetical protein
MNHPWLCTTRKYPSWREDNARTRFLEKADRERLLNELPE